MKKGEIILSVKCLVYNHGPYLRQCLDGIVKQQTNFRFEAIVHDDVSTDNSAEIIREYAEKYPDIIKPIYETENQYSKNDGSLSRVMRNAINPTSKYVATCEGDDYWIDPLKLQKQVDFLEAHPDYGMVHTAAKVFDQQKNDFKPECYGSGFGSIEDLFIKNTVCTLTTCYRADFLYKYAENVEVDPSWKMGDYPLWLYIAMNSKIHFLNEATAVYRFLPDSASHSSNIQKQLAFEDSSIAIKKYFLNLSGKSSFYDQAISSSLFDILAIHVRTDKSFNLSKYKQQYGVTKISPKLRIANILAKVSFLRNYLKKRWS